MEDFVRRLFADAGFRREFAAAPERATDGLASPDREAVLSLAKDLVSAADRPSAVHPDEPLMWV